MSDQWKKAQDMADKHAGSGIFIRLANNGDKVVGVFCGEPHAMEKHWTGERYQECAGKGCAGCVAGKPTVRIALNFFVLAEGAMKVIEGSGSWFQDVITVREKYGLDKNLFEVKRHGQPGDPKTKYSILFEKEMDDALRARIKATPLHDLKRLASGDQGNDSGPTTISMEVATELGDKIRSLPSGAIDAYLKKFGIKRVRDLPASDEQAARTFLAELAAQKAPQKEVEEVDPWA